MTGFSWLQFSDLHFNPRAAFDRVAAQRALWACFGEHPELTKCDYLFITGDIADRSNYDATAEHIGALIGYANVPLEHVFGAVGNHDIKRTGLMRNTLIQSVRTAKDSSARFQELMFDDESRGVLTQLGMADYLQHYETLFKSAFRRKRSPQPMCIIPSMGLN